MNEPELKDNLHLHIDQQTDVSLLVAVQDFLIYSQNQTEGHMWQDLSDSEKARVLKSFDESESDDKIIPVSHLFNR